MAYSWSATKFNRRLTDSEQNDKGVYKYIFLVEFLKTMTGTHPKFIIIKAYIFLVSELKIQISVSQN